MIVNSLSLRQIRNDLEVQLSLGAPPRYSLGNLRAEQPFVEAKGFGRQFFRRIALRQSAQGLAPRVAAKATMALATWIQVGG